MRQVTAARNSFSALLAVILGILVSSAPAQKVTTVAGGVYKNAVAATLAPLSSPVFSAYDSKGNLYVTDQLDHRIRKISPSGVITTIAGKGIAGFSGDNGPAKTAKISYPMGILIDGGGNIIFVDRGNYRLRKIDTKGKITTIAGNGSIGPSGDGKPALQASLGFVYGIALDGTGTLYMSDLDLSGIRKIDPQGIMQHVAGNSIAGFFGDGGPAAQAELHLPKGLATDSTNNLYIADWGNSRIRRVDTQGIITTFAGDGELNCTGDGGSAIAAGMGFPLGLLLNGGTLFVSAECSRVRSIDMNSNVISAVVGGFRGYDGDGHDAASTQFYSPEGLSVDSTGSLLVVDTGNQRVRRVDQATHLTSTFAGGYSGDGGRGNASSLNSPESTAIDSAGNLYIADTNNNRIRKLSSNGIITGFAGTGISGYAGDGGPAASAKLYVPVAVATDKADNLFIADQGSGAVRKVDISGTITTLAVSPLAGGNAPFLALDSLGTDASRNVYGTDFVACVVWKVTPNATITAVAGVPFSCGYNSDGIPATQAKLSLGINSGVAFDSQGNLYIGDSFNNLVRKVDVNTGLISTVAGRVGNNTCIFGGDGGPATSASLCNPRGVAVDSKGMLYIADEQNLRVRSVNAAGTIQTLAGTGSTGYNGNGLPAVQTNLDQPVAVTVKAPGFVYVVDQGQNRVRKIH
jgi:sugar lactone lactonase YvrE